jgi:radical SAM-linked protein
MAYSKIRIRFEKSGDLRLISHHDLMRCFERMLRRADLPMHWTKGFNPHPRLSIAAPLPLGIVGSEEVVEVELEGELTLDAIQERLIRVAPQGLRILRLVAVAPKATAQVRRVGYRVDVPPPWRVDLPTRIRALRELPVCWVERTRPKPRRFDLKPFLESLHFDGAALDVILKVTPTGGVRPEEVLQALGLGDLITDGVVFHRYLLELNDEVSPPPALLAVAAATDRADGPES